ncbi:hypothetical protein HDU98_002002 [Podochytrium sp. JEL0797]|nr:hypothetical protein HDU98_002002 [Podochytrium sp. JEL0797]
MPKVTPTSAAASATHEDVFHPHDTHTDTPGRIIAIAVDKSPYSEYAFDWMIENAVRENDQIVIINCRAPVTVPTCSLPVGKMYHGLEVEVDKLETAHRHASHELLKKFAARVPAEKYNMRGIALVGDARETICEKVAELKAALLVIGARGKVGMFQLQRALHLGSVSDYLAHHCSVPVVVAHPSAEFVKSHH